MCLNIYINSKILFVNMTNEEMHSKGNDIINSNQLIINSEIIRVKHIRNIRNEGGQEHFTENEKKDEIMANIGEIEKKSNFSNEEEENKKKELTKLEIHRKYIKDAEDNCDKCPLRCLVCIPICIGYGFLALFDFLTYLFVPFFFCALYTITFIFNSCKNVISTYQVEEEIGFSGAFTSENEIKLHINDKGGVFHLTEILCFSYMSACIKRYFCFIFVLINHIVVPIMQAWNRAKKCFMTSKIEELYDIRIKQIEEESSYKGYDKTEPPIELINI